MAPRAVVELSRWGVADADGEAIGELVLLEIDEPGDPLQIYRAENASGQWLGYVDLKGRVFQRLPFESSEQYAGMYPMDEGLAVLFEEQRPVRLRDASGKLVEVRDAVSQR